MRRVRNACVFGLFLCVAASMLAVSDTAWSESKKEWAQPVVLEQSDNFYKVSDDLYRAAQPSSKGMRAYEAFGIKTVINLRGFHTDMDEVKETELMLIEIPIHTWSLDADDGALITHVLQTIRDAEKPVLIHCQHGSDRTGMMVAMYRIVEQGWTKEEALDEMRNGGFGFHRIWKNIPKAIAGVDAEATRAALR